jgi:hypothetical protein
MYESTETISRFGGADHSKRTDRCNGIPDTAGMREGAPNVVYNGVQSLKYMIDDAIGFGFDIRMYVLQEFL